MCLLIIGSWATTLLAAFMVLFALVATVFKAPDTMNYFVVYFLCTASIFALTFSRIRLLKIALFAMRRVCGKSRVRTRRRAQFCFVPMLTPLSSLYTALPGLLRPVHHHNHPQHQPALGRLLRQGRLHFHAQQGGFQPSSWTCAFC